MWSSDSRRVTFQSARDGDRGIFWQVADGSGTAERLTTAAADEEHVSESWSADGTRLLFSVVKGSTHALWMFTLEGRKTVPFGRVASNASLSATFSPDGRWVAYLLDRNGRRSHLGQSRSLRRAVSAHWRKASSPGGGHRLPSGVVARRKKHLCCSHGGSPDNRRASRHAAVGDLRSPRSSSRTFRGRVFSRLICVATTCSRTADSSACHRCLATSRTQRGQKSAWCSTGSKN